MQNNLVVFMRVYGMKKIAYYITEMIFTIIYSFLWHYFTLMDAPFGWDSGSGDITFDIMFWIGIIIYCILLVIFIILGKKKIDAWKWYDYIITVVLAIVCMLLGLYLLVIIF